jgi:hypothetical protein
MALGKPVLQPDVPTIGVTPRRQFVPEPRRHRLDSICGVDPEHAD